MAADAPTDTLIAGRYAVEPAKRMPDVGGGLAAFAASDRKSSELALVAISVTRHASPRLSAIQALTVPIDNLMTPVAHGIGPKPGGGQGYYVICTAPPGPPVSAALEPWPEAVLLEYVLRPAAAVLSELQAAGLTHRAIRPDNVFSAARSQPITLGAAWAAPPAMHQPAVFESPFSAICHPAGRGEGTIAEDVYALGVLLITLVTGRVPMAGMDPAAIALRKLDVGSYAALTEGKPIPPFLSDLLRGMLAEEADHRPQPKLLMDPFSARVRRIAARPVRRAPRPLPLSDIAVYDARVLAFALTIDEKKSVQALRSGAATQWLRRGLGDAGLATLIEDLVRVRATEAASSSSADSRLLMHAISTIESRMPLCWRQTAFWPDSIPALLAEGVRGEGRLLTLIEDVLREDVLTIWSASGPRGRPDLLLASTESRQHSVYLQKGGDGALLRLFYALNLVLPCGVASMADAWVLGMPDLMRFLEKAAAGAPSGQLIDSHLGAFIAARADRPIEQAVNQLIVTKDERPRRIRQIALLCDLQQRFYAQPMPGLATWVAAQLRPELEAWRNRTQRAALLEKLDTLAQAGFLTRILALVEDETARADDDNGARMAVTLMAAIDHDLAEIDRCITKRQQATARIGREMAAAVGMMALILMSLIAAVQ